MDDGYELKSFAIKIPIQNCQPIAADQNQREIMCDSYYCMRKCKDGFRSSHPMKVFCKKDDASGGIWATNDGEATLGPCELVQMESVETDSGIMHRNGSDIWRIKIL